MLEDTDWQLVEDADGNAKLGGDDIMLAFVHPRGEADPQRHGLAIIKRYDFESKLQRMSVIVKYRRDQQYRAYVKGSPEKVAELCIPSSLPANYDAILEVYTNQGYRVIALATKSLPDLNYLQVQQTTRDKVECGLNFLGFLIMENKLKGAT